MGRDLAAVRADGGNSNAGVRPASVCPPAGDLLAVDSSRSLVVARLLPGLPRVLIRISDFYIPRACVAYYPTKFGYV